MKKTLKLSANPKHEWNKQNHTNKIVFPILVSYSWLVFFSPYGIHKFINS